MENYQGDLGDIIRSTSSYCGQLPPDDAIATTVNSWQFGPLDDFGHPFSATIKDPLPIIQDSSAAAAGIFSITDNHRDLLINKRLHPINHSTASICNNRVNHDHMISGSSSMENSTTSSRSSSVLQISPSPQNTGTKRRKGQAKKVVCIPAPMPANSRSTGEIVPSDLWAWRKYGQKPIKGSPYPRGYYRCSSLKGCSARKQVERSRTDPNMLVITYTSEHNHPWPTQRNALAGSTRNSQPGSRNSTINASKNPPSAGSDQSPKSSHQSNLKEEQKESTNNIDIISSSKNVTDNSCLDEKLDREIEEENGDQFSEGFLPHENYMPVFSESTINSPNDQDLFADLGEINEAADPLKLLFSQGFTGDDVEREISHKGLDSFSSFYDWTVAGKSNNTNVKSYGEEAKREV